MGTKHTNGPWKVIGGWDENGKGVFPSVILHGNEARYIESYGRSGITINTSHDQKIESIMANAKLIAAAPDLLSACISALKDVQAINKMLIANGHHGYVLMETELDEVIKKATL